MNKSTFQKFGTIEDGELKAISHKLPEVNFVNVPKNHSKLFFS